MKNSEFELIAQLLSHELRNPLSVVFSAVVTLQEETLGPLTPDQKLFLQMAADNCEQMLYHIDDIQTSTKIESGDLVMTPKISSLRESMESLVLGMQPLAERRNITLISECAQNANEAFFDPPRIRQVIANLVSNAIKFTPGKGVVTLRLECDQKSENTVRFSVTDTGPGVPKELQLMIFRKHFQTGNMKSRSRGLGLGLYICSKIIQLHGGRIHVEDAPGGGSCFFFSLPKDPTPSERSQPGFPASVGWPQAFQAAKTQDTVGDSL